MDNNKDTILNLVAKFSIGEVTDNRPKCIVSNCNNAAFECFDFFDLRFFYCRSHAIKFGYCMYCGIALSGNDSNPYEICDFCDDEFNDAP